MISVPLSGRLRSPRSLVWWLLGGGLLSGGLVAFNLFNLTPVTIAVFSFNTAPKVTAPQQTATLVCGFATSHSFDFGLSGDCLEEELRGEPEVVPFTSCPDLTWKLSRLSKKIRGPRTDRTPSRLIYQINASSITYYFSYCRAEGLPK